MKIAAILPESMIDFPRKYGPVIFTQGCNFSCGFCHNPSFVPFNGKSVSEGEFGEWIKKWKIKARKGWYNGITISGGEPCIQPDLGDFIEKLKKETGLAVKLDTNGSSPLVLDDLRKRKLIDYVAMDIKGDKDFYFQVARGLDLRELEKSMALTAQFPDYEFRMTVVPEIHTPERVADTGRWINSVIHFKPKKFYLQPFVKTHDLLNQDYQSKDEPSQQYLLELKEILKDYAYQVEIR